jgi:hypothetical protein
LAHLTILERRLHAVPGVDVLIVDNTSPEAP